MSIAELADEVRRVVGFEGGTVYDTTKPDGTPRKLLDVALINSAGWRASTHRWVSGWRQRRPSSRPAILRRIATPAAADSQATWPASTARRRRGCQPIARPHQRTGNLRDVWNTRRTSMASPRTRYGTM